MTTETPNIPDLPVDDHDVSPEVTTEMLERALGDLADLPPMPTHLPAWLVPIPPPTDKE